MYSGAGNSVDRRDTPAYLLYNAPGYVLLGAFDDLTNAT